MICSKCKTPSAAGERFCASCGAELKTMVQRAQERLEREDNTQKIGRARRWLLAVSILTFLTGIGFYYMQSAQVEKQIKDAEAKMAGISPEERDAHMKAAIGMTWQQAIDHDRGGVKLLFAVNMALAAIYLGLWFWAKKNAFAASVVALILFLSVIVVSAILEPASLAQGWLVKIFFTAALAKAISAAYKERSLYGARV